MVLETYFSYKKAYMFPTILIIINEVINELSPVIQHSVRISSLALKILLISFVRDGKSLSAILGYNGNFTQIDKKYKEIIDT